MKECYYCGWTEEHAASKAPLVALDQGVIPRHLAFEADHLIPRSAGGVGTVTACGCCNATKSNKHPATFMRHMKADETCRTCWKHYALTGGGVFADYPTWAPKIA